MEWLGSKEASAVGHALTAPSGAPIGGGVGFVAAADEAPGVKRRSGILQHTAARSGGGITPLTSEVFESEELSAMPRGPAAAAVTVEAASKGVVAADAGGRAAKPVFDVQRSVSDACASHFICGECACFDATITIMATVLLLVSPSFDDVMGGHETKRK